MTDMSVFMDALLASQCKDTLETLGVNNFGGPRALAAKDGEQEWFQRLPKLPSLTELRMPVPNVEASAAFAEAVAIGCPRYDLIFDSDEDFISPLPLSAEVFSCVHLERDQPAQCIFFFFFFFFFFFANHRP